MRYLNNLAILAVVGALTAVFFSPSASGADRARSIYQNASASCHGSTDEDDARLQRSEQRLKNVSNADAIVVCSLATDALAVSNPDNGTIDYVAIWGKSSSAPASRPGAKGNPGSGMNGGDSLTCTLLTSYADDTFSQSITQTVNNIPVATPGGGQAIIQWIPEAPQTKFLSPVNLRCIVHPNVELNDWLVIYTVNVGG